MPAERVRDGARDDRRGTTRPRWPGGRRSSPGATDVAYLPSRLRLHRCQRRWPARVAVAFAVRRQADAAGPVPARGRRRGARSSCAAPGRRPARCATSACPGVLDADSIIACEVITPAGNWSSYPPHKHDEERAGEETELEEIYYFELQADSPSAGGRRPDRLPAGLRHRGPADRRPGRGAHRRRRARAARLARPGDGAARLRPLLPQRHGRSRHRAGLADLRRPGPRAGSATPGPTSEIDPTTARSESDAATMTRARRSGSPSPRPWCGSSRTSGRERDGERQKLFAGVLRHLRPRQRRRPRPGAAAERARRTATEPRCPTCWPATSRPWCTPPSRYARQKDRLQTWACTASVGPGSTNMLTGAALATINRIPVLLLPSGTFATRVSRTGAAGARAARMPADVTVNDAFRPLSRFFDRVDRPEQLPVGAARRDAGAHRPGRDRRGHDRAAAGRAGRGATTGRSSCSPSASGTSPVRCPRPSTSRDAAELDPVRASGRSIVAGGGVHYSGRGGRRCAAFCRADRHPGRRDARPARAPCRTATPRRWARSARPARRPPTRWPREADVVIGIGTRWSDFTTASRTAFQDNGRSLRQHQRRPLRRRQARRPRRRRRRARGPDRAHRRPRRLRRGARLPRPAGRAVGGLGRAGRGGLPPGRRGHRRARRGPADPGRGARRGQRAERPARRRALRGRLDAGRPAQAVAGARPQGATTSSTATPAWATRSPASIGIRLADETRDVFAMVGDGGYLMMPTELVTAVQERVKVIVVLVQNHGFHSIGSLSESPRLAALRHAVPLPRRGDRPARRRPPAGRPGRQRPQPRRPRHRGALAAPSSSRRSRRPRPRQPTAARSSSTSRPTRWSTPRTASPGGTCPVSQVCDLESTPDGLPRRTSESQEAPSAPYLAPTEGDR